MEEYNKKYDNVARGFYDENGPKLNIVYISGKSKDEVRAEINMLALMVSAPEGRASPFDKLGVSPRGRAN